MNTLSVLPSKLGDWHIGYQRSQVTTQPFLRINGRKRAIILKVPKPMAMIDIERALAIRHGWIERFLANLHQKRCVPFQLGTMLPLEGEQIATYWREGQPSIDFDDAGLRIQTAQKKEGAGVLENWLRTQARTRLNGAVADFAKQSKVMPKRIAIRDTKSRWGSCSTSGTLSFSWRIIMAPPPVLHYLAAHEVAHMTHMDHSPAFWAQVGAFQPDWPLWRDWLSLHGMELMRLKFA